MQLTRSNLRHPVACGLFAAALLAINPVAAFAYTGPGLGLGAIGSALGILAALLLMLISIIWYPFKRMLRRMRGEKATRAAAEKQP